LGFDPGRIPGELLDAVRNGECVVFVGAGLSAGAGLPDWKRLLTQMTEWCRAHGVDLTGQIRGIRKLIRDGKLIDAAQTLRERMGEQRFFEFAKGKFRDPKLKPTENHLLLAEIKFAAAVTTNFDKLIEDGYAKKHGESPRAYTQDDIPALANLLRERSFYVLKAHGDADRPDTMVLGRADYRQIQFGNEAFRHYFSALLQTRTMLFLGFSLDDPDIALRLDELAVAFRGYGGRHYALLPAAARFGRLDADHHIQVIPYRKTPGHPEVTEFLRALKERAAAAAVTAEDQAREREAIAAYRRRLIGDHEYLDFRGILQVREVLQLRLEDLYVPLSAMTGEMEWPLPVELGEVRAGRKGPKRIEAAWTRRGVELELFPIEAWQPQRVVERRVPLREAWRQHMRLVVLGDPGSGKSALLKFMALKFARGREHAKQDLGLDEERLPLLVPIAAYGEEIEKDRTVSFSGFLLRWAARSGLDGEIARRALERGECLVLLDGMDEVLKVKTRIETARQIDRFLRECDQRNRVVITSRIAGYQRAGLGGEITHLTLLPFSDEEMKAFARNWARAYESRREPPEGREERARQRAEQLEEAIQAPAIQRLATKPLLVTILALIHHQGMKLPHQRVELYRLCVEALSEHWHLARQSLYRLVDLHLGSHRLDEPYVVRILAPIAFRWFETRPTGLLHRRELEERIAARLVESDGVRKGKAKSLAREFVDLIREQSGLLDERGADLFDFLHPTFKEYLAARYLAERLEPLKSLEQHLFEPRWREIVLLTAGVLKGDHLNVFLEGILKSRPEYWRLLPRPLLLAGRCLADDVAAAPALRRRVAEGLVERWRRPEFRELWGAIGSLFAEAKGSSLGGEIAARLAPLAERKGIEPSMLYSIAMALGQLGEQEKAAGLLLSLAEDQGVDLWRRCEAAAALGQLGEREKAVGLLLSLAEDQGVRVWVRREAAEALGQLGEREKAVGLLLSLAEDQGLHPQLRQAAAEALGQLGEREKAVGLLLSLAEDQGGDADARSWSAEALGQLGEREKAVGLLLSLAEDQRVNVDVRRRSAEALGQLGEREKAVGLLLSLAEDQRVPSSARAGAASALGRLGGSDKRVQRRLALLARSRSPVRNAARGALWNLMSGAGSDAGG